MQQLTAPPTKPKDFWPQMNTDNTKFLSVFIRVHPWLNVFFSLALEVKSQRQLELPVGPRPDLVGHRGGQRSERAASRALGVRLARLNDAGRIVHARRAAARRCEDRAIQEVVALGTELKVLAFGDHELLG